MMRTYKSFQDFADEVGKDDQLSQELSNDPAGTIQKVKIKDKWVYRMAIWFLGIVALIIVFGALVLNDKWDEYPEFLIATASTAIGAIAGLISQNS